MERLRLAFLSSSAPVIDEATVKSQKNYPKWWKPAGTSEISFPPHWRKRAPLQTQADCLEVACTSLLAFAPARDRSTHGAMHSGNTQLVFVLGEAPGRGQDICWDTRQICTVAITFVRVTLTCKKLEEEASKWFFFVVAVSFLFHRTPSSTTTSLLRGFLSVIFFIYLKILLIYNSSNIYFQVFLQIRFLGIKWKIKTIMVK